MFEDRAGGLRRERSGRVGKRSLLKSTQIERVTQQDALMALPRAEQHEREGRETDQRDEQTNDKGNGRAQESGNDADGDYVKHEAERKVKCFFTVGGDGRAFPALPKINDQREEMRERGKQRIGLASTFPEPKAGAVSRRRESREEAGEDSVKVMFVFGCWCRREALLGPT